VNEHRTVTLATVDHGDVTLPEPSWCRGHADHHPGSYLCDITHYSAETVLSFQGIELFRVMVTQSPHATHADHQAVTAFVEEQGYTGGLDPVGLYDLAATLEAHADRLREYADRLTAIRDGGAR